jgi:hypothetical protein
MPIKISSSGIFETQEITAPIGETEIEAINEVLDDAASDMTNIIDHCERQANGALRFYGMNSWRDEIPANANPAINDAVEIMGEARLLRKFLSESNVEMAARCAYSLGICSIRLFVRRHEKPVITGRKVRRITADGRESEGLRLAKERKIEEYEKWAQCAQEYRTRHPNYSDWDVARHVAEQLKTSQKPDTIRKALRKISGKV